MTNKNKLMACVVVLAVLPVACLVEDTAREPSVDQAERFDDDSICRSAVLDESCAANPHNSVLEKKGIVDCDNKASKNFCKECGNGGSSACCPPAKDGWECDILCSHWEYDPKDRTIKWCP